MLNIPGTEACCISHRVSPTRKTRYIRGRTRPPVQFFLYRPFHDSRRITIAPLTKTTTTVAHYLASLCRSCFSSLRYQTNKKSITSIPLLPSRDLPQLGSRQRQEQVVIRPPPGRKVGSDGNFVFLSFRRGSSTAKRFAGCGTRS